MCRKATLIHWFQSCLGLYISLLYAKGQELRFTRPLSMDFFETQERYRRREMRGWMTLIVRATVIGGCLWLGWLWGHAEQTSLACGTLLS